MRKANVVNAEDMTIHIDYINNAVWDASKELLDHIHQVPIEMIYETSQNIDDSIAQLMIAKTKLERRKI